MADVYQNGILYNVGKAIKNGNEYPFDWTMLTEYNQLQQQYSDYQSSIDDIQANLRTSIQNKGVEVPTSATLAQYPSYVDQIDQGGYVVGGIMSGAVIVTGQWGGNNYGGTIGTYMSVVQKDGNLFGIAAGRHYTSSSNDGVCYGAFGKKINQAFYGGSTTLIESSVSSYFEYAWWQDSTDLSKLKLKLVYRWSGSGTSWTKYYNYMDIDIDAGTITKGDPGTETYNGDNNPLPSNWVSISPSSIPGYTNGWATNVTTSRGYGDEYFLTFTLA